MPFTRTMETKKIMNLLPMEKGALIVNMNKIHTFENTECCKMNSSKVTCDQLKKIELLGLCYSDALIGSNHYFRLL
jgi:hypothetical protein